MALPKFGFGALGQLFDRITKSFPTLPEALDDEVIYGPLVDRLARRTGWHPETVQTTLLLLHANMDTRNDRYFGKHTYEICLADLKRFEKTRPGEPKP